MEIAINGKTMELSQPLSVTALLDELGMDAGRVAVELNLEILPREHFAAAILADGDRIEVVQFVGGG